MPIYALGALEPEIHPEAYLHPDAIVIGRVQIGAGVSIWPGAVLRGDTEAISVGAGTNIQDGVIIHTSAQWPTVIGERVTVGHSAHLEGAVVDTGALIGAGAILLAGSTVGAHALIGAGALLPPGTHVPSRARALGVPARIHLDAVDEWPAAANLESYDRLALRYREELRRLD